MAQPLVILCGFDDGTVGPYMGIEHEDAIWLVTAWIVGRASGFATPERMIRLGAKQELKASSEGSRFDYEVAPVPKASLTDLDPKGLELEVRSLPDEPRVHRSQLRPLPAFP